MATEPLGHTFTIPYANEIVGAIGPIHPDAQLGTAGGQYGQFIIGTNPAQDKVLRTYIAVQKTDDEPWIVDPRTIPDFITVEVARVDTGVILGSKTFGAVLNGETFRNGSRLFQTKARGFDGITTLGVPIKKDENGDVRYRVTINPMYGEATPLEVILNINDQDLLVVAPLVWV